MRIIGIDPGSRLTGWGIVEVSGEACNALAYGVIKAGTGEFTQRLGLIFSGLLEVTEQYRPDEAAVETVFVSRNAASAIKLGQARGAAVCAAISRGLPVSEYAPRAVKLALVGRGSAEKGQVQHMVRVLLGLSELPPEDAADALAVALCHHHTRTTLDRMASLRE